MWVFGYGSLMEGDWAHPLGCKRIVVAELRGYMRVFNKKSSKNWGSTKHPCPTLNLEPREGTSCLGVAFEFPDENEESVRAKLREREGKDFPLRQRRIRLNTGHEVEACVPNYEGTKLFEEMSIEGIAKLVQAAKGRDGSCVDYINQVAGILSKLGIKDGAVTELVEAVRTIECQKFELKYIAILEDAGPSTAAGVWFPDLPGCFSAGDDIDEALRNAGEAIAAYAEALAQDGRTLPAPRSLSALRDDPEVAPDLREHIVALVAVPAETIHAAE